MFDGHQNDYPLLFVGGTNYNRGRTQQLPATKRRYVLERYPSRKRGTAEYNPLYDTFQPITPPHFHYQAQNRPGSIYERPCTNSYEHEQQLLTRERNNGE
ncbi:unnamed protein product [Adineta steineri]|uniref:Uncharacterized protein n=1 Tax=Adineta steineri TaxID=433720 RepID=A0A815MLL3_9BILA|nr:unnamed protein product [Adineta steineri]CAF1424937.1 unnamed protein product [Adineta steineri]CAF1425531.1 unnamed protein product [Adineta steineri]